MLLPRRVRRWCGCSAPASVPASSHRSKYFKPAILHLEDRLTPSAGALDPSFGMGGKVLTDNPGAARDFGQGLVAIQADGKVVVAGASQNGSVSQFALTRYAADGSPDATFGIGGNVLTDFPTHFAVARGMAIQPDGKIVVVGLTRVSGLPSDFALARYNTNGSLDTSFGTGGMVITDFYGDSDEARGVVIKPNGKIFVAGTTIDPSSGTFTDFAVARYDATGSLETGFGTAGKARFDFSGGDDFARGIALQSDGKLVVAGSTINFFGTTLDDLAVTRFMSNGSVDATFAIGGKLIVDVNGNDDFGRGVALNATGQILVVGTSFDQNSGLGDMAVLCVSSNGALDVGMDGDGIALIDFGGDDVGRSVAADAAGRIVIAGSCFSLTQNVDDFAVARLMPNGSLDTNFSVDGQVTTSFGSDVDQAASVAVFTNGCIVAAGQTQNDIAVAKFDATGSMDVSFSLDGQVITEFSGPGENRGAAVALQSDGKIVVAGTTTSLGSTTADDFLLVRYAANGNLDSTFGTGGIVTTDFAGDSDFANAVAIQSDGRIVVVGLGFTPFGVDLAVARYNSNGTLDSSFGVGGKVLADLGGTDTGTSIVIQSDGKLLVVGHSFSFTSGTLQDIAVTRFNTNGSMDTAFGTSGVAKLDFGGGDDFGFDVALRPNGKILVVGTTGPFGSTDLALARFTQQGLLDPNFGVGGKTTLDLGGNEEGKALAILDNNKIIVGGNTGGDWLVARYDADGILDLGFGSTGKTMIDFFGEADRLNDLAVQADGRIVGVGSAGDIGGNPVLPDFALARLKKNGDLNKPFGTQGKVTTDFGGGNDSAAAVAIQADGMIVATGAAFVPATCSDIGLARYDGSSGNNDTNDVDRSARTRSLAIESNVPASAGHVPHGAASFSQRKDIQITDRAWSVANRTPLGAIASTHLAITHASVREDLCSDLSVELIDP